MQAGRYERPYNQNDSKYEIVLERHKNFWKDYFDAKK